MTQVISSAFQCGAVSEVHRKFTFRKIKFDDACSQGVVLGWRAFDAGSYLSGGVGLGHDAQLFVAVNPRRHRDVARLPVEREGVHAHRAKGHQVHRKPVAHVAGRLDLHTLALTQEVLSDCICLTQPGHEKRRRWEHCLCLFPHICDA